MTCKVGRTGNIGEMDSNINVAKRGTGEMNRGRRKWVSTEFLTLPLQGLSR